MTEGDNVTQETLNPQQEAFCSFYTQIRSTFGNATRAYAEAYDYDLDAEPKEDWEVLENGKKGKSSYEKMCDVCAAAAYKLLRKAQIDKRVKELLAATPNEAIDARLNEIILKGRDVDSVNAIKELNKLRQRIVDKLDVTSGGKAIGGFNFVRNDNNTAPEEGEGSAGV